MKEFTIVKDDRVIGRVTVEGKEVHIYERKRKLKTWVKVVAALLLVALLACIVYVCATTRSISSWYQECDEALGYKTDYYACRQYHINGR